MQEPQIVFKPDLECSGVLCFRQNPLSHLFVRCLVYMRLKVTGAAFRQELHGRPS